MADDILSTDESHGGVTDEQIEQFFATNPNLPHPFATNDTTTAPPVGGVEGSEEPAPAPTEPSTEPEPAPQPGEGEPAVPDGDPAEPSVPPESPDAPEPLPEGFVEVGGQRYPISQLEAARDFQEHLQSDPQLVNIIRTYLTGQEALAAGTAGTPAVATPPAGVPQQPELELDLNDPSIATLARLIQQQNNHINELQQGLQSSVNAQLLRQQQETNALWETASTSFAKEHELDSDDIDTLSRVAARLGVLPQLMSGVDPITGAPSPPSAIKAFDRALEIAMLSVPEYRDREFRRSVQTQQEQAQHKKLLGAVGGSSGSVARTNPPPKPGTPEAKRAMLAEVGAMLNGEWNDPNSN